MRRVREVVVQGGRGSEWGDTKVSRQQASPSITKGEQRWRGAGLGTKTGAHSTSAWDERKGQGEGRESEGGYYWDKKRRFRPRFLRVLRGRRIALSPSRCKRLTTLPHHRLH